MSLRPTRNSRDPISKQTWILYKKFGRPFDMGVSGCRLIPLSAYSFICGGIVTPLLIGARTTDT